MDEVKASREVSTGEVAPERESEVFGVTTAGAIAPVVEIDGGDVSLSQARAQSYEVIGLVFPLSAAPQTSYPSWREQQFSEAELGVAAISSDLADPEGDGFGNLLEYALGLDPRSQDASPVFYLLEADGEASFVIPKGRTDLMNTTG